MRLRSIVARLACLSLLGLLACARRTQSAPDTEVSRPPPQGSPTGAVAVAPAAGQAQPSLQGAAQACTSAPAAANHGAVLELFTSEGCSSCPPADALLAQIVADADRDRAPVYALAFHVDYWDYLGWKDAFSASQYSQRQGWYASRAAEGGVYTPELVVSGTEAFVGSDRGHARSALRRALETPWPASVSLSSDAQGRIGYRVAGGPRPAHLNLALVQRHAQSRVLAGENSGSTLNHVNVVRAFERVPLDSDTDGSWMPRRPVNPLLAIAYVQDDRTLAVVGAASVAAACDGAR